MLRKQNPKAGKAKGNNLQKKGNLKKNAPPKRREVPKGWSLIEKDELVQAVNGSVALEATKFPINPALPESFPIGATEAKRWTEWKADTLQYYFKRTVSQFATQGTTGRVVLAVDYSAINDAPTSLQEAEALHHALGMPCDEKIRLHVDPSILNKADPKYIRSSRVPPHSDIRLYDGGNLWFVTSGCQNATEIGELRVKYRFLVRLPNLDNTAVKASSSIAMYNRNGNQTFTSTVAAVLEFNEEIVESLGITLSAGVFTLPEGAYLVHADWCSQDGTSETFAQNATALVDGVTMAIPAICVTTQAAVANVSQSSSLSWYVESDGTTTTSLQLTLTGAAGALNVINDRAKITFLLV